MSSVKKLTTLTSLASLALFLLPAAQAEQIDHAYQYEACISLIEKRPETAFEAALAWASKGGGYPAEHCAAQALFGLEIYDAAASRLEGLAQTIKTEDTLLRAQILHQAGRGWMLHGDLDRAYAVQKAAIDLDQSQPDFFVDRAEVLAELGRFNEALEDLNRAHTLAPQRDDILAFRATAWRFAGQNANALSDANAALQRNPDNLEALLERGIVQRLSGNNDQARADWLRVLDIGLGTPAADAAQINLERMDLKAE
ncbi:BTAD domain-containing putative transcriptional regulator [Kiloniella sp. b19]|uniref:BTAD domain-containing putative transcriptional regulator n=1 Tax=Kiloniella sp. GXU_MW_B19 TaxID=3141326 RepID=UPI0031D329A2